MEQQFTIGSFEHSPAVQVAVAHDSASQSLSIVHPSRSPVRPIRTVATSLAIDSTRIATSEPAIGPKYVLSILLFVGVSRVSRYTHASSQYDDDDDDDRLQATTGKKCASVS